MNIWFSSDWHYSHRNITGPKVSSWKSGYRNFSTTHEMNETIVSNVNSSVKANDVLYFLGDWSFADRNNVANLRDRIDCNTIHFIRGNHDQHLYDDNMKLFTSVSDVKTINVGGTLFHLSHYSHQAWPKSHKGSIHLFGHSHGNLKGIGKSMDVGIDCHTQFRPFHIDEIRKLLSDK